MIQCQNCGQVNNYGSNFCRFCGSGIIMSQNSALYEHKQPRPYAWKTDEFQLPDTAAKKTGRIHQVQPLANLGAPAPAVYQQPQPMVNYGYRCHRCGTQNAPYITRKISSAGWIVFAILLVMFFPLFWIGFLIKEDVQACSVCHTRVG
jgi:RNA polymerase subunit RPABC4/transcription elongation factor Spt4